MLRGQVVLVLVWLGLAFPNSYLQYLRFCLFKNKCFFLWVNGSSVFNLFTFFFFYVGSVDS